MAKAKKFATLMDMKTNSLKIIFISAFIFFTSSAFAIQVGERIPELKIKNQNGKTINLNDYKGQFVLLYFYPKDDTKGCTVQATTLRDQFPEFKKHNAVVFGVSRQGEKSHKQFIEK